VIVSGNPDMRPQNAQCLDKQTSTASITAVSRRAVPAVTSLALAADDGPMATLGRGSRAGLYAEKRYRRGRRSWRRSTRRLLAISCGPFIAAGLVVLVVDGHLLSWAGGVLFGAFIAIWIAIRETPPRYVEKWQAGAEGERKTARALRRLERKGWTLRHDVQRRYGNYDHIAVGPSGVYLLETKKLEGVVEIRDGVPHLSRRHDPDATEKFTRMRSTALSPDGRWQQSLLETAYAESGRTLAYLGDWHSHPRGPRRPSGPDRDTAAAVAASVPARAPQPLTLIIARRVGRWSAHSYRFADYALVRAALRVYERG
jgi:integrative and conjugative element protein (TIGR02256 family)